LSRRARRAGVHALDEEIEKKKDGAKKNKDESRIDLTARKAAERTEALLGNSDEAGLLAAAIERADKGVTGKAAAESPKFIMSPNGEVGTVAPEKDSAQHKNNVAKQSQKAEPGASSPIHKTSPREKYLSD
jgi:hypothetical protein